MRSKFFYAVSAGGSGFFLGKAVYGTDPSVLGETR